MPIYEYQCSACGHEFERWQKISDGNISTCPECGKKKVEKLMSMTSFQLKGEGWYVTEYGTKKGKEKESGDSEPSSEKTSSEKKDTSSSNSETKKPKAKKKKAAAS